MAGLWVTGELMGQTEEGAYSEAFLGEPAVEYFPKRAFVKLKDPKCKWKRRCRGIRDTKAVGKPLGSITKNEVQI